MGAILLALLVLMTVTLCVGIWIGPALIATGVVLLEAFTDRPTVRLIGTWAFNVLTSTDIVSLPLFILMGELLFRTRLSQSLFSGIAPWMGFLPGRLLHTTVIGCSMFAAISGSSAATTQVVGRITLTELLRRGYDKGIAVGSLGGAGTLGFLIPPSIPMIIYAVLAEESLLRLFTAGFIPGFALAGCFMAYIAIRAIMNPGVVPEEERRASRWTWGDRARSLVELGPVAFLIFTVLGTMYLGYASPSEAAAIGVVGALVVAAWQRTLTVPNLRDALLGSVQTTCMIGFIVLGAFVVGTVLANLRVPQYVSGAISSWNLPPFALIAMLVVFYVLLGTVLEGFSMIVLTLPIVLPVVMAAGFDKVWFGIFLILTIEMAQISPPVAFNLFVIQGITGDSQTYVAWKVVPFFLIMIGFTAFITVFPGFVTFLPDILPKLLGK
ncbi:MAG: TRAP transporter large permease subunit [Rhodospirillales bacterium]|nr:MAG: TRAP transporter large permease subunit [Rhodospirillales bacterium]